MATASYTTPWDMIDTILVTALLVEIDEAWHASKQPYINWNTQDAGRGHRRMSRRQVA